MFHVRISSRKVYAILRERLNSPRRRGLPASPRRISTTYPTKCAEKCPKPLARNQKAKSRLVTDSLCVIASLASGDEMNAPATKWDNLGKRRTGADYMTDFKTTGVTRRALLGAFAATSLVAAPTYSNAAGLLRGAGDIRRIKMYSSR